MKKALRWLKNNYSQILLVLALICLAIMVLYPLYLLVIKSFKSPSDDMSNPYGWPEKFFVDNYKIAWEFIKNSYLNSIIITLCVTVGIALFASMASFAFIRYNFVGKNILFISMLGLLMIPGILTLISRYKLISILQLNDNYLGVILPAISGGLPMSIFLLNTFFKGLPKELFEAAEIDGASDLKIYFKIVIPLSRSILSTIIIIYFVGQWNDYLWSKLVLIDEAKQTLPVILVSITEYLGESISYSIPFAGYVLSAIPLVIIFIFGSKQFIDGMTSGAFKM